MPKKRKIFDADDLSVLAWAKYAAQDIEKKSGYRDDYFLSGARGEEVEELLSQLSDSGRKALNAAMKKFVKKCHGLLSNLNLAEEPEETDELWGKIQSKIELDHDLSQFLK